MFLKHSINLLLYTVVVVILFILFADILFVGMINHVDTMAYHAFAGFIESGIYKWTISQPYTNIHTGSPPLYSLLLRILYLIPRADIVLHVLQIGFAIGYTYLTYRILLIFLSSKLSLILSGLLFLIPGNLIYISFVLPEIITEFFFVFYVYLLVRYIKTQKNIYLSWSIPVGFLMGLWKYSFFVFGILSMFLLLFHLPRKINEYIVPFIGCCIFIGWMLIQHQLTGVWGLSEDSGIRYNIQMMYRGKVLPPESDPSVMEIRKYISKDVDLRQAYWDLEPYLIPSIGYDYIKLSKLTGDVGKAAMGTYPGVYVRQVIESFFMSHIGGPMNIIQYHNTDVGVDFNTSCGNTVTIHTCQPIISLDMPARLQSLLLWFYTVYYQFIFPFWSYMIFFPMLVASIFLSKELRLLAILFIIGRLFIAMATWQDPRYVIPFYPIMVIISAVGISRAYQFFSNPEKY